jgi:hypothetical protein
MKGVKAGALGDAQRLRAEMAAYRDASSIEPKKVGKVGQSPKGQLERLSQKTAR